MLKRFTCCCFVAIYSVVIYIIFFIRRVIYLISIIIPSTRYLIVFHFYNTCLNSFSISFLFSGGLIISSKFLKFSSNFTILSSCDLATASAILFPKNLSVLWTTFLEGVFKGSSQVSHNYFLYLSDRFLQMTKIHIISHIFLFLVLQNSVLFLFIDRPCQTNFVFYF